MRLLKKENSPSYSTLTVLLHDGCGHLQLVAISFSINTLVFFYWFYLIAKLWTGSIGYNKSISAKLKIVPTAPGSLFNLNHHSL